MQQPGRTAQATTTAARTALMTSDPVATSSHRGDQGRYAAENLVAIVHVRTGQGSSRPRPGMGHVTLWCGTCSDQGYRGTRFYEPPHQIGHNRPLSGWGYAAGRLVVHDVHIRRVFLRTRLAGSG